ncbi:hypothetical protein FE257_006732 [Aspergillus nanangensis]|uniref:FAD/NAD(P)-binding domain-containing protein n=1 Tax=Aspergillus nanangensis TaxID=2582783 RepID=A0AAD4GUS4_ASPNN|nr:hypothetical protein FE257_006732 [Aspergillus nanangensis]
MDQLQQNGTAAQMMQRQLKDLDIDPEALKVKYKAERDKRLPNGGNEQYVHVATNELNAPLDDPYADPNFARDPVTAVYDVVLIGGGYTALQAAARLMMNGHTNICLIEKAGGFGGTWYWNRYPGAQCDVESYIYMPLLEELGVVPSEKYVRGPELLAHAELIGKKYDLYDRALFQTQVQRVQWDDDACLWKVHTDRNDHIQTRWVVTAPGPLHSPKLPGVPGILSFKGKFFHSSRWDYAYTGGSNTQPDLTKLADKRVAVVGTGATAIQIIPEVAKWAKELNVFQRTPSSVDVRNNRPTDPKWAKNLPPGWQRNRMQNFTAIINGEWAETDLVNDGWTAILSSLPGLFGTSADDADAAAARLQLADFRKMETVRKRVDSVVKDPETAERLKPWYNQFCKRPCFHDGYLQVFNQPNVYLVDTDGKGIERVTERGIVAKGVETEVDCIIYSTGFEFAGDFTKRNGPEIIGRNGLRLTDKWDGGPSTYHGYSVVGFPNLMIMSPLQSGANPNYTHNIVDMSWHLVYLMDQVKKRNIKALEATPEAEAAWVADVIEKGKGRSKFLLECTPGYYNDEGRPNEVTIRSQPYGGGSILYAASISKWRQDDKLEGMSIRV